VTGSWILIVLCLGGAGAAAADSLRLVEIPPNRLLPHLVYDQGIESIPLLHPDAEILVSRRTGELGDLNYALIVYKPRAEDPGVVIEGAAQRWPGAWRFSASCPDSVLAERLVDLFERLGKLTADPAIR